MGSILKFFLSLIFVVLLPNTSKADIGVGTSSKGKISSIEITHLGIGTSTTGILSSLSPAEISVQPDKIDLGAKNPATAFAESFSIKNEGDETLTGTISVTAYWIISINPTSFGLGYDETVTIEFSGIFPTEVGYFSTDILINSNGGNYIVTVLGEVVPPAQLVINPQDIDLGSANPLSNFSSSFTIKNIGGETLTGNISEMADWITSISAASFSLGYNESIQVDFSGSFPQDVGAFSTDISVTSNGGNAAVKVNGIVTKKLGSISGYVLYDGTPIPNQKVYLYEYVVTTVPETYLAIAIADENGLYVFDNLENNNYFVGLGIYNLPDGYTHYRTEGTASITNGSDITDHNIYLGHDIKLNNPTFNEYVSSPVTLNWESHSNEVIYSISILNTESLIQFNHTTSTSNFQKDLLPGNYVVDINSYSDESMLAKYYLGSNLLSPFKVDIPSADDFSGSIATNITWSGEVHITGDITIEEGTTLTIEPGTKIYISDHDELEQGYSEYDKSVISITVLGDIIANGSSEKPILFTPEKEFVDASVMFWDGIHLNNSNNSSFEYSYFSCSNTGISLYNCSPRIQHSVFSKTVVGISFDNTSPDIQFNDFYTLNIDIMVGASNIINPIIRNNNFYISADNYFGIWALYYDGKQVLDCRNNYWGYSSEGDLSWRFTLTHDGTVLYQPAFDESVGGNSWAAEFKDWNIFGSQNSSNQLSKKTVVEQDSALISLLMNTLGPKDGHYASLGYGGFITFDLGLNNTVIDSNGYDINIYESIVYDSLHLPENEAASVLLGNSIDGPWDLAAVIHGSSSIDIDSLPQNSYRYIKIQDISFGDSLVSAPGFDLDAIKVKNSYYSITDLTAYTEVHFAKQFILEQNFPNPFNPSTTISYKLNKAEDISIDLFSINGKFIKNIFKGRKTAGQHEIKFNSKSLSSGVYLYRLKNAKNSSVRKMILLR